MSSSHELGLRFLFFRQSARPISIRGASAFNHYHFRLLQTKLARPKIRTTIVRQNGTERSSPIPQPGQKHYDSNRDHLNLVV